MLTKGHGRAKSLSLQQQRSVQPRQTHLVLKGRRFSAARSPPEAVAPYPAHAPNHLLTHMHRENVTPQRANEDGMEEDGSMHGFTFNLRACH